MNLVFAESAPRGARAAAARWLTLSLVLYAALAAAAAGAGRAAEPTPNWPRFRGPDGLGLAEAPNLPAQWSEQDFNWKVKLPGVGHSSPAVWGERVFVTCADEEAATRTAVCLKASDGSVLWSKDVATPPHRRHGDNSYASSSPTADAERVYFLWPSPRSLVLQAFTHDGAESWKLDLGPYEAQHGGGTSPVVYDDLVIVACDQDQEGAGSFLAGVDARTGNVRWKTPRNSDKFSASTPCVYRPKGGGAAQLVFTAKSHGMTGVDPTTGAVLWEVADAFDSRTVGSATADGESGLAFATCGEGAGGHWLVAIRPAAGDGGKATVAYKITKDTPYVPTPLVSGPLLFYWSDTGVVTCAKAATGEKVWEERVRGGGGFFSSPVCAGGRLYCVSKNGDVVVLNAGEKFELLARNELAEKCHATPAVAGGRMYVRTYGHLISVGGK